MLSRDRVGPTSGPLWISARDGNALNPDMRPGSNHAHATITIYSGIPRAILPVLADLRCDWPGRTQQGYLRENGGFLLHDVVAHAPDVFAAV